MNKKLKPIYSKLCKEYKLTEEELTAIVSSPYSLTKLIIDGLDLRNITEEEFDKLETNFMYKYIGKLYTNYRVVKNIRSKSLNYKNINNKKYGRND